MRTTRGAILLESGVVRQSASINSKNIYRNFVQKVPEHVRKRLLVAWRVMVSAPANHSLFSVWSPALCFGMVSLFSKFAWFSKTSSKPGDSDSHSLVLSTILESFCGAYPYDSGWNCLLDAIALLDFQVNSPSLGSTLLSMPR